MNLSRQHLIEAPNVVSDLRFHCGRNADRLVDTAEVVVRKPQRQLRPVVLELLTEGVREARKAPDLHPHGEVAALHVGRTDAARIRITDGWDSLRGNDLHRGVQALAFLGGPVNFDELSRRGRTACYLWRKPLVPRKVLCELP